MQRGSILYMTAYAGDPLTPGIAATKTAKRLTPKEAVTLARLPTTPISYEDAAPILQNLGGPVAPREWQGALPFTYHIGPGASKVHLKLEMDFQIRPIWNVVAQIPGTMQPDWWVVVGNHRDAWTYGASAAEFTAAAKALGQRLAEVSASGLADRGRLATVNHAVLEVERNFLLPNGLLGRSWFRHALYAPGVYTE